VSEGKSSFTKEYGSKHQVDDLFLHGLRVNTICVDYFQMFSSTLTTAQMMIGGMARIPYLPLVGLAFQGP
jgi:hypothetical protein